MNFFLEIFIYVAESITDVEGRKDVYKQKKSD